MGVSRKFSQLRHSLFDADPSTLNYILLYPHATPTSVQTTPIILVERMALEPANVCINFFLVMLVPDITNQSDSSSHVLLSVT